MSEMPKMMTVKELAAECKESGISAAYIRNAAKAGKFPFILIGRKMLINREKFIEYLNKGAEGGIK